MAAEPAAFSQLLKERLQEIQNTPTLLSALEELVLAAVGVDNLVQQEEKDPKLQKSRKHQQQVGALEDKLLDLTLDLFVGPADEEEEAESPQVQPANPPAN